MEKDIEKNTKDGVNACETLKLGVGGMTCAACSAAVERALMRKEGVQSASVNLVTGLADVEYDPALVAPADLAAAVKKTGYEAFLPEKNGSKSSGEGADETGVKTLKFGVNGMTCAACSAAVERALKRKEGVQSASVNLVTRLAEVEYDPALVRPSELAAAVKKAGYEPFTPQSEDAPSDEVKTSEASKKRLILAAVFTVPLFYLAMGGMIGLPIPDVSHKTMLLTQLFLTLPVLWAGRPTWTRWLPSEPAVRSCTAFMPPLRWWGAIWRICTRSTMSHRLSCSRSSCWASTLSSGPRERRLSPSNGSWGLHPKQPSS
jgi:Cu+-exporting ATPase